MLVHASTDDDGLRWKHAFWNAAPCSLFLIALQRLFLIPFSGEEAFQLVDRHTGQLSSHILTMLEKGVALFGDKMKAEMLQSTVEIVTDVCPNILAARLELQHLRAMLLQLADQEGLTLISAGTHPSGSWMEQLSMPNERYLELEEELQDVARSILIPGSVR